MCWSAVASDRFSLVGGHFFGPGDGTRAFGTPVLRATEALLAEVDATGTVPQMATTIRAQARADVTYWRADCVALYSAAGTRGGEPSNGADAPLLHPVQDRELLTALFGPGRLIGGVWTWSTSQLSAPAG